MYANRTNQWLQIVKDRSRFHHTSHSKRREPYTDTQTLKVALGVLGLASTHTNHVAIGRQQSWRVALSECARLVAHARNDQQRLHWCEAQRLLKQKHAVENTASTQHKGGYACHNTQPHANKVDERQPEEFPTFVPVHSLAATSDVVSRAEQINGFNRKLLELSNLYVKIADMVQQQSNTIDGVERNINSITARLDSASDELVDAAPRSYRSRKWRWYWRYTPKSLSSKLRLCLLAALCFNFVFVFCVLV